MFSLWQIGDIFVGACSLNSDKYLNTSALQSVVKEKYRNYKKVKITLIVLSIPLQNEIDKYETRLEQIQQAQLNGVCVNVLMEV